MRKEYTGAGARSVELEMVARKCIYRVDAEFRKIRSDSFFAMVRVLSPIRIDEAANI